MPSAISKLSICNRALQLLGQPLVTNLNESSRSKTAVLGAYDTIFLAELEAHTWSFAIRRASLAAHADQPLFGKGYYYPVPGDFLFIAPEERDGANPLPRDWEIENYEDQICIVTNDTAPIPLRYVSSSITESAFSPTFAEAFAYAIAVAICEDVTNSNTKLQNLMRGYNAVIDRAKKRNDIQKPPAKSPTCSFITVRD